MEFKNVSKKAIANMLLASLIGIVIILTALSAAWFWLLNDLGMFWFTVLYWGLTALICIAFFVSPFVRYKRYKYQINDVRVAVCYGLIFLTTEIAPIERVHQISVMQGPIDRLTGLAKVEVTTAGGEITVRFLEKELAETLATSLENTIKNIVAEQGGINEG